MMNETAKKGDVREGMQGPHFLPLHAMFHKPHNTDLNCDGMKTQFNVMRFRKHHFRQRVELKCNPQKSAEAPDLGK